MTDNEHINWTMELDALKGRILDLQRRAQIERVPYCRAFSAELHDCLGRWVERHAMEKISPLDEPTGVVKGKA